MSIFVIYLFIYLTWEEDSTNKGYIDITKVVRASPPYCVPGRGRSLRIIWQLGPPSPNVHQLLLLGKWAPGRAFHRSWLEIFVSHTELPTATPLSTFPFFGLILLCQQGEKMWLQRVRGQKKGHDLLPRGGERCCMSFMHTPVYSRRGIGQKHAAFCTYIAPHYARHNPKGGAYRPTRSLETKWCDIEVV